MTYDDELNRHIADLNGEIKIWTKELEYYGSFLTWMDLWDDFIYFRMNAHLEQDEDEPFPRYVL